MSSELRREIIAAVSSRLIDYAKRAVSAEDIQALAALTQALNQFCQG